MHFVPAITEDLERIEVVLGPASALYGPQTANGVVHMITKSPLTSQGTMLELGTGPEKDVLQGSFRTAHKLSDNFAFKISGQAVSGNEWRYVDPQEQAARAVAFGDPSAFIEERLAERTQMIDRLGVLEARVEGLESSVAEVRKATLPGRGDLERDAAGGDSS